MRSLWRSVRINPLSTPAPAGGHAAPGRRPRALLQRAGGNVQQLKNLAEQAMADLPRVQQQGDVQVGSELARLLQASEKEALKRGDQFIASELFLLALADAAGSATRAGALLKQSGVSKSSLEAAINAVRGGQNVDSAEAEGQREALKKYTLDLTSAPVSASSTR